MGKDSATKWLEPYQIEYLRKYLNIVVNPYQHPSRVPGDTAEAAKAYFAWELLHGTDVEKLKKDPYWKYMEE